MTNLLLPSTDGGVLAQAITAGVVFVVALVAFRRWPTARLVSVGAALVIAGVFGLRALH